MVENELVVTTGSLSQTKATMQTSDQNRLKFPSEMTAQYFEHQKLPPLLSANQELRHQTHFRFSQTLSHTLQYSFTHNTILSHTHY